MIDKIPELLKQNLALLGHWMLLSWSYEIDGDSEETVSTEVKSSGKGFLRAQRSCLPEVAKVAPHAGSCTW